MKKKFWLIGGCMLAVLLVYVSCRKGDRISERESIHVDNPERFFTAHPPDNPAIQGVIAYMKRENSKNNFTEQTIKQVGYPVWDKALIVPGRKIAGRGTNTNDTLIIIPFVRDSQQYVNSSLTISLSDADTTANWFCDWQYTSKPYAATSVSHNSAEQFALFMMMMDDQVFGHKDFVLTDTLLFRNLSQFSYAGSEKRIHLEIDSSSTGGRGTNLHGTPPEYNWTMWYYYILDVYGISGFYSGIPNPYDPGQGGGSGGAAVPPPPTCGSGIPSQRGAVVQIQACEAGWVPPSGQTLFIPFFATDTIINNFTNPCIIAAKNKLPNINLNIFARSLYFAAISQTYNWKIIFEENRNLVDNANNPQPAESFAVTPNKEWHVVLNPLFWEQGTQPDATQEIAGLNILHEIVHGFIRVYKEHYNLTVLNTFTTHEVMFKNFIDAMSSILQSSFSISSTDAKALALQGLDDVLQKEYTEAGALSSYNTAYNQFSISNYGISIPESNTVFADYLNGTKGTRCF